MLNQIPGYYSPIFATFQQKEISGILTVLWQNDPSKAKWSILAKGYSVIRDSKGKGNTPLDIFLAINGPFIGVIAPDAYLGTLGWSMIMGEAGQVGIRRVAGFKHAPLNQKLLTSTMSVDDIIQHSIDHGFISENRASLTIPSHQPNLTMASLAQPIYTTSHTDDAGVSCDIAAAAADTGVLEKDVTSVDDAHGRDQTWALNQVLKIQAQIEADDQARMGIGATTAAAVEEELYAEEPVLHEVEDPNFMLASDFYTLEGEYPFNNEFNPDLPTFTFDPFMGDDFCGYNMSDWVNPEAYEEDFDAED